MAGDEDKAVPPRGAGRPSGEASSPPLVAASFFTSEGVVGAGTYAYGRDGNPTWTALEEALGALEDATSLVFASGQAASLALLLALAERTPRVVLASDGYYGVRRLAQMLAQRGVESIFLDLADHAAVARELATGPSVLWAETPTNPLLRVFDLAELGRLAADAGAPMVVDNTTATAALQQPLRWGATASLYSLTKATSGHSDVILGAVTTRDAALVERLRAWRSAGGGIAGPFEAWLALRGVRTLSVRVNQQSRTAEQVALWLEAQPSVRAVHYPGLDPAGRALAERQMPDGSGPLLSFELDGAAADADAVVAASRIVRPATSFGGVESTWERRARWASETAVESLIRLSVGLEPVDDLIGDIGAALGSGHAVRG